MFLKAFLIPRAKWHAIWEICTSLFFMCVTLIILEVIRDSDMCALGYFILYMALFTAECLFDYLVYVIAYYFNLKPNIAIPLNVPHIAERYGLFIMLILGESLISIMSTDLGDLGLGEPLVVPEDGSTPRQMQVLYVFVTFLLAYMVGRLYYDCQPPEESLMEGTQLNVQLFINVCPTI